MAGEKVGGPAVWAPPAGECSGPGGGGLPLEGAVVLPFPPRVLPGPPLQSQPRPASSSCPFQVLPSSLCGLQIWLTLVSLNTLQ